MSLFKREEKPKRDINDILTPKEADECEIEAEEAEVESEEVAESPKKEEKVVPKGESKEEFGLNALSCFGWKEDKTDKWLIKSAHIWYAAMSFFWFLFGALTFAPIIFISKKINVIFKNKTIALAVATVIWVAIIVLIISLFVSRNGDKAKDVAYGVNAVTETMISE